MTTNLLSVIEQQQKALEEWERVDVLGREPHIHRDSWKQFVQDRNTKHTAALAAGQQALEQAQWEPIDCAYYSSQGACCEPGEPCKADRHNDSMTHPQATEPAPKRCGLCGDCDAKAQKACTVPACFARDDYKPAPLSHLKTETGAPPEQGAITSVNGSEPAPSLVCPPAKSNGEPSVTKGKWFSDEAHPSNAGIAVVADAIKEALQDADLPAPTGCGHCQNPLYAGTKCKSFGRVNEPAPSTAGERAEVVEDLLMYAGDNGYSHIDYADTMRHAAALLQSTADHITDAGKMGATQKIGCVQHDCAECQARAAMPVGDLTHLKGVDAGPLSEWVDLVTRGYVSKNELLIMEKDAVRVAAARSHPTTEESLVVAGAQPVREPLSSEKLNELWVRVCGISGGFGPFARAIEAAHGITKKGEQ